jgi:hypothetical protein
MASIHKEIIIRAQPSKVWAAICDLPNVHRLFAGVLTASRVEPGARLVTFANGAVVRELIINQDDDAMRFVYAAVEGGITTHHNASWQLFDDQDGGTRFVWISDFLPDESRDVFQSLVDAGCVAMKRSLEEPT